MHGPPVSPTRNFASGETSPCTGNGVSKMVLRAAESQMRVVLGLSLSVVCVVTQSFSSPKNLRPPTNSPFLRNPSVQVGLLSFLLFATSQSATASSPLE